MVCLEATVQIDFTDACSRGVCFVAALCAVKIRIVSIVKFASRIHFLKNFRRLFASFIYRHGVVIKDILALGDTTFKYLC